MAFRTFGMIATVVMTTMIILQMGQNWRRKRDGSWHGHYLGRRYVQRRLVDGKWQYRDATAAELEQRARDEWNAS